VRQQPQKQSRRAKKRIADDPTGITAIEAFFTQQTGALCLNCAPGGDENSRPDHVD